MRFMNISKYVTIDCLRNKKTSFEFYRQGKLKWLTAVTYFDVDSEIANNFMRKVCYF